MNPYYSLPLATAPYYREARVTLARRQTACRMRHCCARRIVETGGRRKLGCTSTRWAERQRIVKHGKMTIRMAYEMVSAFTSETSELFKPETANPRPFSGGSKGGILFGKRIPPLPRVPTALGQNPAPFGQKRKYSLRCINKKRSTNKRKLRITYHEQNENRYDHCLRTA